MSSLVFSLVGLGCGDVENMGEPGAMGEPGEQGEAGPAGPPGPKGDPGEPVDYSQVILNRKTVQTADFNIDGDGFIGGSVGIGTTAPTAQLSVGAQLGGTALSTVLNTNAGMLGTQPGNDLALASIGFRSGNYSSLGIRAMRATAGSDWTTTAIGLGMDVDNTVRAGGSSLFLSANGGVGIGTATPVTKLDVRGGIHTDYSGSTVQTVIPNSFNTITHNLNIPPDKAQLVFVTNGHVSANNFIVTGLQAQDSNSFVVHLTGGAQQLGRLNWFILIR